MEPEDEVEDFLHDRVKEMIDEDVDFKGEEKPEMRKPEDSPESSGSRSSWNFKKQGPEDEKVERDAGSKIPGPWDPDEIEYLANNRKEMDNRELEEFLSGNSEIQKTEFSPFSRSEERFILQNHNSMTAEEIAESLDRHERSVELQMTLMGLKGEEI